MPGKGMFLSSSPHAFSPITTNRIMLAVVMALVPATAYGIYLYGLSALGLVLVSVIAAVAAEYAFRKAVKASTSIGDLSAVVTGLLLALVLPPSTPLWMAALGSIFAIVVAKEFFGGIGANPFNPALSGRAFMLMSFPAAMTTWTRPQSLAAVADAASSATPLGIVKMGADVQAVATSLGASDAGALYWQLFLGNRSGSLGESSILLITLGGIFLLATGVIQIIIPASIILSTAIFSLLLGMDPIFSLLSGGVIFAAFFMATDYSSSPLTPLGKLVFGVSIGFLVALIRKLGAFPEGVTYAILIMNMLVPFLDKLRVRKYGFIPPAPKKAAPKAPEASR
jgi:electron transport complex protein RnfD